MNDESTIKKIIELRNNQTKDWWAEISMEERVSIEKGIEDADTGKLKPHSEARKIYAKWL